MKPTRWLHLTVAAWIGLGSVAIALMPAPPEPGPGEAQLTYGEKATTLSSAPAGLMALRRILARLDFQVTTRARAGAPTADVLVLVGPAAPLSGPERSELLAWLEAGGRLIYGGEPAPVDTDAPADPNADPDNSENEYADPDNSENEYAATVRRPFSRELVARLEVVPMDGPDGPLAVTLGKLGRGRVAIVGDAKKRLSNQALTDSGLGGELPWLRFVLEDATTVAFDEVHNGAAGDESIWAAAKRAGLGPGLQLLLLALVLSTLAVGVRRSPIAAAPPAVEQSFRTHLASVGRLLQAGTRDALARAVLLQGTRRRLGALATRDDTRERLDRVESAATLQQLAESLRHLERAPDSVPLTPRRTAGR